MKRSFAEFSHQRDAPEHDKRRKALKQQIKEQAELDCGICCGDLKNYYQDWKDFYSLRRQIQVTFSIVPLKHQMEEPNARILKICIRPILCLSCSFIGACRVKTWVAGNKVILKNVNANIPVSLSWLLLAFLAFLSHPSSAQPIDSSLQWPNLLFRQK